jgi:small multidrug resistance pump
VAVAYAFLLGAIACEVVGTSLLKSTEGFSRLGPTAACLVAYAAAFALMAQAVKQVQVGVAYAMWSGLGTASIVVIGAVFLGEPLGTAKVLGVLLVIAGVVLLNLGGAH